MSISRKVFWDNKPGDSYAPLSGTENAKYLVVGAGVAGLSAAYFLLKDGAKDIVVIEQHKIGNGSTGHSAGMFVAEPEQGPWEAFVAKYGPIGARTYWQAQVAALKVVSDLARDDDVDCDYMPGDLLILAGNTLGHSHILHDFQARRIMHVPADMMSKEEVDNGPAGQVYDFGERVRAEASANPLKLARGLAKYLKRNGVRIYEDTPLLRNEPSVAITPEGRINFESAVYAMGVWTKNPKIERYLTTIAITRELSEKELLLIGLADRSMFLDDEKRSFHYGKLTIDKRLLLGYGDVFCDGPENKETLHLPHLNNIKKFLIRAFPEIDIPIEYAWSAEYALSKGLLPLVSIEGNKAVIGGAGTQLSSIAIASYAASKLMHKDHPLDLLFGDSD